MSRLYIWSLLTVLLFGSCMSDNQSDCPDSTVKLRFDYVLNTAYTSRFVNEVESVDVFLYDSNDAHQRTINVAQDQLTNGDLLIIEDLDPGSYTAVVWAKDNNTDYRYTNQAGLKQDLRVALKCTGQQVTNTAGSLFHGITTFTVGTSSISKEVYLTKNIPDIIVQITDHTATIPSPISIGDYTVSITSSNGIYKYDNTLAPGQPLLDYIQTYNVQGHDMLESQSRLQRLFTNDDSRIVIRTRVGVIKVDEHLTGEIMRNPFIANQTELDRSDRFILIYDVTLNATTGDSDVTLSGIDDWKVNNQGSGI